MPAGVRGDAIGERPSQSLQDGIPALRRRRLQHPAGQVPNRPREPSHRLPYRVRESIPRVAAKQLVATIRSLTDCIKPTTVEESTPPERNAPSGTSEIICWLMTVRRIASSDDTASASDVGAAADGCTM